ICDFARDAPELGSARVAAAEQERGRRDQGQGAYKSRASHESLPRWRGVWVVDDGPSAPSVGTNEGGEVVPRIMLKKRPGVNGLKWTMQLYLAPGRRSAREVLAWPPCGRPASRREGGR